MADQFPPHKVIDGEVVAAPHVLSDKPPDNRMVQIRCDTHPEWMDCGLDRPDCIGYATSCEGFSLDSDVVTFRIRDRRRLSYPRLRPEELR